MAENMVEVKHLTKVFGKQKALDDVSIHIPEHCVYGLLGPNGAGKSTLLKMLTGILRPTSGEITFDGHPWSREDLWNIGSLIETPPIYENLSAWENLKVRALMLGVSEARMRDVLEIVRLGDTGKKKAGAFSLGMKQRLGIAIALLNRPRFLVLDEPVNGLDPIGIQELREMIRSFTQQGITVLVSSHILSEIEQTADRIAGGVFLCIVSPIALLLLGAMSESGAYGISETAAGMIGLIVLLVLVAVAVASFIFCGSRSEPYEYLEKEVFETESGVERMVRERKAQYRRTYTRNVVTGACLCILAMVPFFAGAIVHEEEDVWMVALFCLAIVIVAVGVVLLVRVGIRWESFQKLLQEGDYTREKKEKDAKVHLATLIYWSVVTALYLVISLPSRDWQRTWIVWVIAAVLYPVLLAVLRLLADKNEK